MLVQLLEIDIQSTIQIAKFLILKVELPYGFSSLHYLSISSPQNILGLSQIFSNFRIFHGLSLCCLVKVTQLTLILVI